MKKPRKVLLAEREIELRFEPRSSGPLEGAQTRMQRTRFREAVHGYNVFREDEGPIEDPDDFSAEDPDEFMDFAPAQAVDKMEEEAAEEAVSDVSEDTESGEKVDDAQIDVEDAIEAQNGSESDTTAG